jgi:hypothetical protein
MPIGVIEYIIGNNILYMYIISIPLIFEIIGTKIVINNNPLVD